MFYPKNDRHLGGINFCRNVDESERHNKWEAIYSDIKRGVARNLDPRNGIFSLDTLLLEHSNDPGKWFNWLAREQFDWLEQNQAFSQIMRKHHWVRLLVLPEIPYIPMYEERKGIFQRVLTYIHAHLWHGVVAGIVFVDPNRRHSNGFNPSDFNSVAIPKAGLMYYIPAYYRADSVGCRPLEKTDTDARLLQVTRGLNLSDKNVIWLHYDERNFTKEPLPKPRWQALRSFFAALYRNNRICEYCTQPYSDYELDHVMPRSERFSQTIINFRPIHKGCNRRKRWGMPPASPFQLPPFIPRELQTLRLARLFEPKAPPDWTREVGVLAGTNRIITSLGLSDL